MQKAVIQLEIDETEKRLALVQGNKFKKLLAEDMKHLLNNGIFNLTDAWKLKKKMFPQYRDPPFALLDNSENLVTDYGGILNVMRDEFVYRLRNRQINTEYEELQELKEYLCKLRLKVTGKSKYIEWTMEDLNKAISKLKTNKCKDPHGHINELYMNMGLAGLSSLLDLSLIHISEPTRPY